MRILILLLLVAGAVLVGSLLLPVAPPAPTGPPAAPAPPLLPPPARGADASPATVVARMDALDRAGDQAALAAGRARYLADSAARAAAGDNAAAQGLLLLWLNAFPRDQEAWLQLADVAQMRGDLQDSRDVLLSALAQTTDAQEQAQLRERLRLLGAAVASQALARGQASAAQAFWDAVVAGDPVHSPWRVQAVLAAARAGDRDTATEHFALLPEWEVEPGTWRELEALVEAREADDPGPGAGSVRLTERRGQLLAPVVVAGRRLSLLVDTGATLTTLKRRSVAGLTGLRDTGERVRVRTAGGDRTGDLMEAGQLVLGGRPYGPRVVAVLDLERLSDTDGLLGMDLLGGFALQRFDGQPWLVREAGP